MIRRLLLLSVALASPAMAITKGGTAVAVTDCPSVFQNSETVRNGIAFPGVTKGKVYGNASPGWWPPSVLPSGYVYSVHDVSQAPGSPDAYVAATCLADSPPPVVIPPVIVPPVVKPPVPPVVKPPAPPPVPKKRPRWHWWSR